MKEVDEINDLTPQELSLLILTNDGLIENSPSSDNSYLLTTKEIYIWGILISELVESNYPENEIIAAVKHAVNENHFRISKLYNSLFEYDPFNDAKFDNVAERLVRDVKMAFIERTNIQELKRRTREAFNSLIKEGLIEDPIFTSIFGASIAIAGFLPYGFTKKTNKGITKYKRVSAIYWTYEKSEKENEVTTHVNFRLFKIVTAFKKAFAEIIADEMGQVNNNPHN